ncbi:MAG: DMT family transporter [Rubellimicrobium sp.]|nr:DMT family transporter [Rubellimicrobium sp.]
MLALTFGITAACAWAVHDLLVRRLSQGTAILPMLLTVLAVGSAVLALPVMAFGDWSQMTPAAAAAGALSGLAYAFGMGGLYKAFSIAPVRLVAPILGAYPMLSLGIAGFQGRDIGLQEWLAVAAIVGGIAVVALAGRAEDKVRSEDALQAILWAVIGSTGFGLAFWLGQEAARLGAQLPAILVTRLAALMVVAGVAALVMRGFYRAPRAMLNGNGRLLAMMGVLDALALGLVTASGGLDFPEYAAIAASLFGVLTILLAWRILGEVVWRWQWLGIGMVFAGIAALSVMG